MHYHAYESYIVEADSKAKAMLWKKLQEITSRYQLDANTGASSDGKDYSELMVRAAVALKASPIPGERSVPTLS